jgi:acyl-coenzyme A thioesterase PaaI-like protein
MTPNPTQTAAQKLADLIQRTPYIRRLGVRMELAGDEMTAVLPYSETLIGDPGLPALHGGVLGAFLELTALAQLFVMTDTDHQPRPVGVTVEYLRSGRPMDKRIGSRVANVYAEAWQETRAAPITCLHGRFLLTSRTSPSPAGSSPIQTPSTT